MRNIQTTQMANGKSPYGRSRWRLVRRFLLYGGASVIVLIFVANIAWQASGSGEWALEMERDGVKVYSLKAPGTYLKQFKAVMQAEYSLNQLVAGLIENSTLENCHQSIPDCIDLKVIEPWNSKIMSDTVMWKLGLPKPFAPREVILRSQVMQDPVDKTVVVDLIAAPNSMPRNPGSIRLTHIQNRWIYKPLGQGKVEIEFQQNMDMGGLMPRFLINMAGAEEVYKFIHDQLPQLLDKEQFRNIKYDFIREV